MDAKETPGFRDAIHVPFVVVTCETTVQPGEKVSLRHNDRCVKWDGREMWHGVANPFRESPIKVGEAFQVYIRSECFSGLRHDFQIEVHDTDGTDTCHSVCNLV